MIELYIISLFYYLYLTGNSSNSLYLLHRLRLPHLRYAPRKNISRRWYTTTFPSPPPSEIGMGWGGGWGGLLILPYYPICCTIHPDLIHTYFTNCTTSSMSLLILTIPFHGRVNPPPHHLSQNDNIFLYILSLSIYFLSLSPQIISSPHNLFSWWNSNISSQYLTISYTFLLTIS